MFGVSSGNNFEHDFTIWDGDSIRAVTIEGNYFDSVQVSLDSIRDKLGLPKYIELNGNSTKVVRIPTGFIKDPDEIGDSVRDFAFGAEVSANFKVLLS